MADTLSNILRVFNLESAVYFQADFPTPWGMDIKRSTFSQFHLIVRGTCFVSHAAMESPIQLSSGDIVLFPHGTAHWLGDREESERLPGAEVVERVSPERIPF